MQSGLRPFGSYARLTDSFTRSDANPIDGGWVDLTPSNPENLQIVSNAVASTGNTTGAAYWAIEEFGPDCEGYWTVGVKPANTEQQGMMLRVSSPGSNWNGYQVIVFAQSGTDTWQMQRVLSGSATTLASGTQEFAAGDKFGVRLIRDRFELWYSSGGGPAWALLGYTNDSRLKQPGTGAIRASTTAGRMDDVFFATVPRLAVDVVDLVRTPVSGVIAAPLISSATVVSTPTLVHGTGFNAPFIASATSLFTPTIGTTIGAPFVSPTTVLYAPTVRRSSINLQERISDTHVFAPRLVRPLANVVLPSISGTAKEGQQLEASPGVWSGTEPIFYSYQWRRCNAGGGACVDITGETGRTYTVHSADVGNTIRVRVTASN